jgi:hypothetical protein
MPQCRTCATEFPATAAGRGRPVAYCSDECRLQAGRVRKRGAKSAIDARIEAVMTRIDELERRIQFFAIPENSPE